MGNQEEQNEANDSIVEEFKNSLNIKQKNLD